jgi:hypothetical protein
LARLRIDSSAGVEEVNDGVTSDELSTTFESRTLDVSEEVSVLLLLELVMAVGADVVLTGVEVLLNKLLKLWCNVKTKR